MAGCLVVTVGDLAWSLLRFLMMELITRIIHGNGSEMTGHLLITLGKETVELLL